MTMFVSRNKLWDVKDWKKTGMEDLALNSSTGVFVNAGWQDIPASMKEHT